ncbi:RNA polymerase sigma factor [Odoribacter lunatus]|uniref:RNA polymerase sigma factor n=1 Tax=Odoribacter lunatus TaxID=2941335 RepID=UPI00203B48B3|nr:RNA polymerase sigma factor [Odoribacter lunatus]
MNKLDDTYYIEKILNGDIEYFSRLVERYSHRIYILIFKIVCRKEDAEEITQDVFLKTFQTLHRFKGDCRFSTWLYKIAYTTAISFTRKKKNEFLYIEESAINNVADSVIDEVFNEADNSELLEKLERAMELLPFDERGLISLFYMENHSIEEIAQITSLTESNIKVKLHRIRKKLYTIIEDMP